MPYRDRDRDRDRLRGYPTLEAKRLDPTSYTENLESASRRERMQFFTEVAKNTNAQGLFLAHHADDLAETFFKRMLEGASIYSLYGMSPVSHFDSLVLFRPLLQVTKRHILQYLQEHNISYFDDPTNEDLKFLRARQRTKIFPFLKESFGKFFEDNLCRQAHDSYELHMFLDEITKQYIENVLHGPWGHLFEDLAHDPFLLKFMIKKIAGIYGCVLSRDQLESMCQNLLEKKANKRTLCGDTTFICDRGRLFVLERKMLSFESKKRFSFCGFNSSGSKEMLYSLPLIALIFWLGLYPEPALQEIEPAAKKLSSLLETSR